MPTRGELISAGFAGLAGILESSSEEDDEDKDTGSGVSSQPKTPLPTQSLTSRPKGDNRHVSHGAGEVFPLLFALKQLSSKHMVSRQRGHSDSQVLSDFTCS